MKRINVLLFAGVLSFIWCGAASATTYINPNGKTTLNLSEKSDNPSGFYFNSTRRIEIFWARFKLPVPMEE